jgi:RNA polymerase sigma factor (TIGR02999 family)
MGETRASGTNTAPITGLLASIQEGDQAAAERLVEAVYAELRRLAGGLMRRERSGHTLQTTALVNDALSRLLTQDVLQSARSRAYFFAAASRAMRQVLVEHARARQAHKRGGGQARVPLDTVLDHFESHNTPILVLDGLLDDLAARNARQAQVVMLRCFGGLTMPEIAEQLGVSLTTVEGDLRLARAWMRAQLGNHHDG